MKNINVTFTDQEHEILVRKKGNLSWHDFIMKLANEHERGDNNNG